MHAPIGYGLLIEFESDELLILYKPTNYMKAISNTDSKKWLEAMKSEIDFMYSNSYRS